MLKATSGGSSSGTAFTGSIAATQVAFGSGANAFAGSANFIYSDSPPQLTIGNGVGAAILRGTANAALTASAPGVDVAQSWNNAAVAFTAAKVNVTNTASAVGSLLQDWQVAGSSIVGVGLGTQTNQALRFGGDASGFFRDAPNQWTFYSAANANNDFTIMFTGTRLASSGFYAFSNSGNSGGTTDTAISRNAAGVVEVNNGTAGAFARWIASAGTLTAVAPTVAASQIGIGSTTATTVGAAGGASALPITPTGYWIINVGGTAFKVPYYAS